MEQFKAVLKEFTHSSLRHTQQFPLFFRAIVLYEYQKPRYHLIEENLDGLVNANCRAHCRRSFSDAVKAMKGHERSEI